MNTQTESEAICCPEFNPSTWDDKDLEWNEKYFVRDRVFTFFNMPVNFGRVMRRLNAKVEKAGAAMPDWLCLSDHTSKWNMNVYLAVDRKIPGAENTTMTGRFYSKVYEGPFNETVRWCRDYEEIVRERGQQIRKWYMWYTTCPRCAKKYGKNYVAIMAQLD